MNKTVSTTYEIQYNKETGIFTLLEYFGPAYSNIIGQYTSLDKLTNDLKADASLLTDKIPLEKRPSTIVIEKT